MAKQTIVPFGPQHPVLPEPLHLDLVLEDERVVDVIPRMGFIHRGLEGLVRKRDFNQYVYVAERICGICSFGHSLGYSETVETLMNIEVPERAEFLRGFWHELGRLHNHLLWLGLAADAFGWEALFQHSWRLRETVLDIFEKTTGGRVIFSVCNVGGVLRDIEDSELAAIVRTLDGLEVEYNELVSAFLNDSSINNRLRGTGILTYDKALSLGAVGPFARGSGVSNDVRLNGNGAYGKISPIEPILGTDGDNYTRMACRIKEFNQSTEMIRQFVDKMPSGEIYTKPTGRPEAGAQAVGRVEQPRGECFYYAKGDGSRFLERFRIRTPTSTNVMAMVEAIKGGDLSDVPNTIITIDPCISCAER